MQYSRNSMSSKLNEWITANEFWADSIRTIVFSFVGALFAIVVIGRIQNKESFQWEKRKSKLNLQLESINSFLTYSYDFTSFSVRFKEDSNLKEQLRDKYDLFRNKLHILKINCLELDSSIDGKGETLSGKMLQLIRFRTELKLATCDSTDCYESIRRQIKNNTDSIVFLINAKIDSE